MPSGDAAKASGQPPLRRVIYRSIATRPMQGRDLLQILHDARAFNEMDNISGMLLHDRGVFFQVLEGPADAVTALLARLEQDERHASIAILADQRSSTRLFPDWKMGFGDLSDPALAFLPALMTRDESGNRLDTLAEKVNVLTGQLSAALGPDGDATDPASN